MGASGWEYRVPFVGSLAQTLVATQQAVLDGGDHLWPWEDVDPEFVDEVIARPASLAELAAAKEHEEFWEEGTHTVLDVDRIWTDADQHEIAAVRPLSDAELAQSFGTTRPTGADLDRIHRPGELGPLEELLGERWTGRSVVLYADDVPAEVFFWGFSGD